MNTIKLSQLDLAGLIYHMNQSLRTGVDTRPLSDLVGKKVSFVGHLDKVRDEWLCLSSVRIWQWNSDLIRELDHVWIKLSGKLITPRDYHYGMGVVYQYRRKNGTVDYSFEPKHFLSLEKVDREIKKSHLDFRRVQALYEMVLKYYDDQEIFCVAGAYDHFASFIERIKNDFLPDLRSQIDLQNSYEIEAYMRDKDLRTPSRHSWRSLNQEVRKTEVKSGNRRTKTYQQ